MHAHPYDGCIFGARTGGCRGRGMLPGRVRTVRRTALTAALIVAATLGAAGGAGTAKPAQPRIPACALGTSTADLKGFYAKQIAKLGVIPSIQAKYALVLRGSGSRSPNAARITIGVRIVVSRISVMPMPLTPSE